MTCVDVLNGLLSYTTIKLVKIEDWRLGSIHYLIQFLILVYVVVYVIFFDSGYQGTSEVVGTTTWKVKGSASQIYNGSLIIYDAIDVIQPATEVNAIFATTNSIITPEQTRGVWPDPELECKSNTDCPVSGTYEEWGVSVGVCNQSTKTCDVQGWGPIEPIDVDLESTVLSGVGNMTILVRANAFFTKYNKRRDNIGDGLKLNQNLFSFDQIVKNTGYSFDQVVERGCIIAIEVQWNCGFDPWSYKCKPSSYIYP
eukprot:TRINITY_DN594_c1_g1_i2.p1 TRINITY_DN594_c1_g1~~TRINITY_DN594_c1_g1_i2.p1  ORF type:complete len:255 (-),score=76.93 TRINITY_DN594_c1_g1_i2:444-1208(-)